MATNEEVKIYVVEVKNLITPELANFPSGVTLTHVVNFQDHLDECNKREDEARKDERKKIEEEHSNECTPENCRHGY